MKLRMLMSSVAAVALAAGGVLVVAEPASAATCAGSGCDNGDPVVYGCATDGVGDGSASQQYSVALPWGGTLWNEWSAGCAANWAKVTGTLNGTVIWAGTSKGGTADWAVQPGYSYGWSNMWDGSNGNVVTVCAWLPDAGYPEECVSR